MGGVYDAINRDEDQRLGLIRSVLQGTPGGPGFGAGSGRSRQLGRRC